MNYELKDKETIQERSYNFALRIIKMVNVLPKTQANHVLGNQILRSGTSIGANIEEALGAHTKSDFIYGMNLAKKEARETNYWLRLIFNIDLKLQPKMKDLLQESEEIIKILTAIVKTSKQKRS